MVDLITQILLMILIPSLICHGLKVKAQPNYDAARLNWLAMNPMILVLELNEPLDF